MLLSPAGVCVFMSVFMGFRFYNTSKFFPAGFVALLRCIYYKQLFQIDAPIVHRSRLRPPLGFSPHLNIAKPQYFGPA